MQRCGSLGPTSIPARRSLSGAKPARKRNDGRVSLETAVCRHCNEPGRAKLSRLKRKKINLGLSILLGGLFGCTAAMAQDRRSVEEIVRALDDQERIAALQRHIPALERLWSEESVVNAPNNQVVVGRDGVLDAFVRAGMINFSSFEREIEFARVDGPLVILMRLETVQPVSSNPSAGLVAGQVITRRFTNIWKNEAGTWHLVIRHANVFARR